MLFVTPVALVDTELACKAPFPFPPSVGCPPLAATSIQDVPSYILIILFVVLKYASPTEGEDDQVLLLGPPEQPAGAGLRHAHPQRSTREWRFRWQ